tara:strand:- start:7717 stop:13662 length:5946 start_codon:yes stop_codon:yes gene_type:complete
MTTANSVQLELGDIIQIFDKDNNTINGQQFIIEYIDQTKVIFVNIQTGENLQYTISTNGVLGNGTINKMVILSRGEGGYALQHNFLPGTWIQIHFINQNTVITGKIDSIEDDMITINTAHNGTIYLDFEYKGIPKNLDISNIFIIDEPEPEPEQEQEQEFAVVDEVPDDTAEGDVPQGEEGSVAVKPILTNDQLSRRISNANNNQIVFGDELLEPVVQFVEVSARFKRFNIEVQVTDMLDSILSTIPTSQRTRKVLNNIHITLERFQQLRTAFSKFDEYGTIENAIRYEAGYKPLTHYFKHFNTNLYWILPVVQNIKKIYNTKNDDEQLDWIPVHLSENLPEIVQLIAAYTDNNLQTDFNNYNTLYNELNPFFTPFETNDTEDFVLRQIPTGSNLNVIIDNLHDFTSSVYKAKQQVTTHKFVMGRYILGDTKLDTILNTNSRLITERVQMTPPDLMNITSIVTLPEPAIRFSKVNLPNSTLLEKVNLNNGFLDYWQLLNNQTKTLHNVPVNTTTNIEYTDTNFANNIKHFTLDVDEQRLHPHTSEEIYYKFINTIIPRTRELFGLMKKNITGKLSVVGVVTYLEPFLIYSDNITFMQYNDIVKFIQTQIDAYLVRVKEDDMRFRDLRKIKPTEVEYSKKLSLLYNVSGFDATLQSKFLNHYAIVDYKNFTNSELLHRFSQTDGMSFYTSQLSVKNSMLNYSTIYDTLLNDQTNLTNKVKDFPPGTCEDIVIAKIYFTQQEVSDDDNITIDFDTQYDKTDYTMLNKYDAQLLQMSPENFISFLENELQQKLHITQSEALYLTTTLISGKKIVQDGQYAILTELYQDPIYFKRRANKWHATQLPNDSKDFLNETSTLCNSQPQCMNETDKQGADNCDSIQFINATQQKDFIANVVDEFDIKYQISDQLRQQELQTDNNHYAYTLNKLLDITAYNMLKYNNFKHSLGAKSLLDESDTVTSPNTKLLNLILKQVDFVKKQGDLVRFVRTFTRPAYTAKKHIEDDDLPPSPDNSPPPLDTPPIDTDKSPPYSPTDTDKSPPYSPTDTDNISPTHSSKDTESPYWLYCIVTDVPLLPKFRSDMSTEYVTNPSNYNVFVESLIARFGVKSDDGDLWTDKNSGWTIQRLEDTNEEEYDGGINRGPIANVQQPSLSVYNHKDKYPKMILNITKSISSAMGIKLDAQQDFIVTCVMLSLNTSLPDETTFNQLIKTKEVSKSKPTTYNDYYNSALLFNTLGMILIAIQTSIPSIKTKITLPGCKRSFEGYPFNGVGDYSSLEYLTCVAQANGTNGEPWNVLKRKGKKITEFLSSKISDAINKTLLNLPDVQLHFSAKETYVRTIIDNNTHIPDEHSLANWINFLPPLVPFKIRTPSNISADFKAKLKRSLKEDTNNDTQDTLLNIVRSKIMLFSLAIQETIATIVKKEALMLFKGNTEPYLENACCVSTGQTITYFTDKDSHILEYNEIVLSLTSLLQDVTSITKSPLFYSNVKTKNIYPPISNQFDEKIIYYSFIHFCKFRSTMLIPEYLLPLCSSKPDNLFNYDDSLDQMIIRLKKQGQQYDTDTFLRLIQFVSRRHLMHTNFNNTTSSTITTFKKVIQSITENETDNTLMTLLTNLLDTYDPVTSIETNEAKELLNYIMTQNSLMTEHIIKFLTTHVGNTSKKTLHTTSKTIREISNWTTNDTMYKNINFYKTFIQYFAKTLPTSIANQVSHDLRLPSYLGLSAQHKLSLTTVNNNYYAPFKPLYGDKIINHICRRIPTVCKEIIQLSVFTPAFTSFDNRVPIFDETTAYELHQYYLLKVIHSYILLTDDQRMHNIEVDVDQAADGIDVPNVVDVDSSKVVKDTVAKMLFILINLFTKEKNTINVTHADIQQKVFSSKQVEKHAFTDRLKNLTDEEREADTVLKINKLGPWAVGSTKGFTSYDGDNYDRELEFQQNMRTNERNNTRENEDGFYDAEEQAQNEQENNDVLDEDNANPADGDGNGGDDGDD